MPVGVFPEETSVGIGSLGKEDLPSLMQGGNTQSIEGPNRVRSWGRADLLSLLVWEHPSAPAFGHQLSWLSGLRIWTAATLPVLLSL